MAPLPDSAQERTLENNHKYVLENHIRVSIEEARELLREAHALLDRPLPDTFLGRSVHAPVGERNTVLSDTKFIRPG
jgi:hypothetical protein